MELDGTVQMLAARLAGDDSLADTLVKNPRATIEPRRQASARAALALDALQKIGGSIEGKLAVHRTIGEGGMGVVHLATQATLGRHVAVKTLRAGIVLSTPRFESGFPAEARRICEKAMSRDPAGRHESAEELRAAIAARVDEAVKRRAEEDERLRKLGHDHDPTVGTRTRTFLSVISGLLWTTLPLVVWWYRGRGGEASHVASIGGSALLLALGVPLWAWARDSMTKTALNRRLTLTVAGVMIAQILLSTGAWLAGLTPDQGAMFHVLLWAATLGLLGIWLERWFFAVAAVCAASFLVAGARPAWLYPIMALDNAALTGVLVFVWFPRQDIETIRRRRADLQRRAQRLFLSVARPAAGGEGAGEDEA